MESSVPRQETWPYKDDFKIISDLIFVTNLPQFKKMADLSELPQDQMLSGTRYDEQPQEGLSNAAVDEEIETSILVVGGGPVGMLLAYILSAYWGIECMLAEQASQTTKYPKMEYTNHR